MQVPNFVPVLSAAVICLLATADTILTEQPICKMITASGSHKI